MKGDTGQSLNQCICPGRPKDLKITKQKHSHRKQINANSEQLVLRQWYPECGLLQPLHLLLCLSHLLLTAAVL